MINEGEYKQTELAEFLVKVYGESSYLDLGFHKAIEEEVAKGEDSAATDLGYLALLKEANKSIDEMAPPDETSPEVKTIVKELNNRNEEGLLNDNGLNLILSALGVDVKSLTFDEFM